MIKGATMNLKIAFALNDFIEMNKGDQQDYLDTLTDYVSAGRAEKAETTETIRKVINAPTYIPQLEVAALIGHA